MVLRELILGKRFKLNFVLVSLVFANNLLAATIGPDLQNAIQGLKSDDTISIVIDLKDKLDVSTIELPSPHERRAYIIKALRQKAKTSQRRIHKLLNDNGVKEARPLWMTNKIAVSLPVRLLGVLEGYSEIAAIELDKKVVGPE